MPCKAGQTGKIEITLSAGGAASNIIGEFVPLHPVAQPSVTHRTARITYRTKSDTLWRYRMRGSEGTPIRHVL